MQSLGHIYEKATGEKILILVRQGKNVRYLKMRKTGPDGPHFIDEEFHLNERSQKDDLQLLKDGVSIRC